MDVMENVFLLDGKGNMVKASNPLNRYSTIRKSLSMQGVGPSYSFAQAMSKKTGKTVGLVVNAKGGSSINSWLKGAKDNFYGEAIKRAKLAMKYGKLKAIIWHQGEADSKVPEEYMAKLKQLVSDLREDLNDNMLPFVVGEIAVWREANNPKAFNKMLRKVGKHIDRTACVSSKGLKPLINEKDPHFCSESQVVLGNRYADAVWKLMDKD